MSGDFEEAFNEETTNEKTVNEEKTSEKNEESTGQKLGRLAGVLGKKTAEIAAVTGKKTVEVAAITGKKTIELSGKAKDGVIKSKDAIMEKMDANGDGKVDLEDIIIMGMRTPGIKIKRDVFLQKQLSNKYSKDVVAKAISSNPSTAGIKVDEIDKIADEVIKYERVCVSGISAALGAPGGVAMAATIPADIAQYYGYLLRTTQELLYLYGFPEINTDENGQTFDAETLNILILCMGVMYGAAGANNAIKGVAKALAGGVEKQLMKKALTKGTIYPIVKSVSKWFGVKMTKEVFAGFFKKAIPVVGGVLGGGITYISFKPCCDKLKDSLRDTKLANPDVESAKEGTIIDVIADEIEAGEQLDSEVLEDILGTDDFENNESTEE